VTYRPGLVGLLGVAACRLGGPSANPNEYVTFPSDAEVDAGSQGVADPGGDGGVMSARDDATTGGSPDATDDGGGCGPKIAVCDPVRNTGCNPLQQCDVDTSQKTTPTGLCVFNSGSEAAAACSSSIFTESCPAQSTCVNGGCRVVCFCDPDCPATQCCSDTSGPAGFTLCQACP
jgi:hypothetical protein